LAGTNVSRVGRPNLGDWRFRLVVVTVTVTTFNEIHLVRQKVIESGQPNQNLFSGAPTQAH